MQTLPNPRGIPVYPDVALYLALGDRSLPWEFSGWKTESMSWKTGCYIHAGLSDWQLDFSGPDVLKFWSNISVNNYDRFPVGSMKHAVMCTEKGLIASHAILQRNEEHKLKLFASGLPWALYQSMRTSLNINVVPTPAFLHQVAGPKALAALEKAADEDLKDIAFLTFRTATIEGKQVEIGRIGMTGNLAYEVRGNLEDGPEVYDAIYRAGQEYDIQKLGWRTYFVNHIEGGFPQAGWTFFSAGIEDEKFTEFSGRRLRVTGSIPHDNMRARFRTPVEVGWEKAISFNHDFIGRAALEAEVNNPRRTIVTLRWNPDDVIDIYASQFRTGEEYQYFEMPTTPSWFSGFFAHADKIEADGKEVGIASGTVYSYYYREVISHATIDLEYAKIGTEVIVHWGENGGKIKKVRAVVERYPYLDEGRNDTIDTRVL